MATTRFAICFRDDFLPLRHSLLRVFPIGLRWGEVEEVTMEPLLQKKR